MRRLQCYLLFILLCLMPLIYFVLFEQYGFFHSEVLIWFFASVLIACSLAWIYPKSNWFWQFVLLIVTTTISTSFLPILQTSAALWLLLVALLLAFYLFNQYFFDILFFIISVAFVSLFFVPFATIQSQPVLTQKYTKLPKPDQKLTPIIYIILDEHAAPEVLPDVSLAKKINAMYHTFGFSIDAKVHSQYVVPADSIPNTLNFTTSPYSNYYVNNYVQTNVLKQNAFFDLLSAKGYQIRVYQTSGLDFCHTKANIVSCYTVPAEGLSNIKSLPLSLTQRSLFFLKTFWIQSYLYRAAATMYQFELRPWFVKFGWFIPNWSWDQATTASVPAPLVFKQLTADILQQSAGTLFFAHILAPHNPYIYNADCSINTNVTSWKTNLELAPVANTPASRLARYQLYQRQLVCTTQQVQTLLEHLQQAGILQKSIVIIHGDYGSRIVQQLPVEFTALTKEDLDGAYRTLFVYKIPNNPVKDNEAVLSLGNAFILTINQALGLSVGLIPNSNQVYLLTDNSFASAPTLPVSW